MATTPGFAPTRELRQILIPSRDLRVGERITLTRYFNPATDIEPTRKATPSEREQGVYSSTRPVSAKTQQFGWDPLPVIEFQSPE